MVMNNGKMLEVPYGQNPYSTIGKYIRDNIDVIEDIIAVIELNGVETNELFMVDIDDDGLFIWNDDWWEGEEKVALIDFFPVSEATHLSARPDNQINLCDSCDYSYPDCPSKNDDVIFGNGIGNDNICACNKYKPSAKSEQQWIPIEKKNPIDIGHYLCSFNEPNYPDIIHVRLAYWTGSRWHGYAEDDITAWMPLPEPWKVKKGEEDE